MNSEVSGRYNGNRLIVLWMHHREMWTDLLTGSIVKFTFAFNALKTLKIVSNLVLLTLFSILSGIR